ncbi:serine/threonine protein kinase [Rothia sp. P5764]|uniref:serine/threonine protein kinase n=1 Tax=Rothia sp. P5764 TaxID=3402654 RepID=UPI003AD62376
MTPQIPLNTLLGDRYKVTAHVLETAGGDAVLDGLDQVLGRKVSIVVAAPEHNRLLVTNARKSTTLTRSAVQVLDLGNKDDSTYLITSHSRPDTLLDVLLTEGESGNTEEFGEEIFGDTGSMAAPNTYVVAKEASTVGGGAISAIRSVDEVADEPAEEFEEYDAEEDGYYEADEPTDRNGGVWIVGIAAALLLVIGAGAVFVTLGGLSKSGESSEASGETSVSASASEGAASDGKASAAGEPSAPAEKSAAPKIDGTFTRLVPSSPTLMAESDSMLAHLTDKNEATTWTSLAFGSPNFGGLADSVYLLAKLDEATTVKSITINQVSGTGGQFTIYASETASADGGKEIGSGSFAASGETTVQLNKDAQKGKTKYIIIKFTAAPQLSQPIVAGYPYGLRIAEISIN